MVERLRKTYQERLVSVVLYGSAAVGDHHSRFSDINVLCVLKDVTPRELGESAPIFLWWRDLGNPAPLLFSLEEFRTSSDCFPIEFHDIQGRHRVLYGEDLIERLTLDDAFYRAEVEHELRSKLLRLRQKAAGALSERDLLLELMTASVSTFCVLFRHALLLHGMEGKFEKRALVEQVKEGFGIDATPFNALLDLREGKTKSKALDPGPLFAGYLNGIQAVLNAVDRLEK